jgi:isocitrate dehydrogenase
METGVKLTKTPIVVAYGDGIGPEIMSATLEILQAAGANIEPHEIQIGEKVYLEGFTSGIKPEDWDLLRKTGVMLKAPITTPQGGGYKSLNVSIRKMLGLFANVRPCNSYSPFVRTHHPMMDVVIVRENEEDLYAGIEHQQTDEVIQCLKLVSKPGTEKIIRYAFEYARAYGRKKVTCFSKDNIMKMTDGLFHKMFDQIGAEYPDIEKEHMIIDIGAAKLADSPERFDVIVTGNLYGDIISDIAAQITGSVGIAGSANIGETFAMFEAIHGSAPDIAGKGVANPSGLLLGAVQMLVHIGDHQAAEKIHNAWLKTIEDGIHTADIYTQKHSLQKVNTREFTEAVIERLGKRPEKLKAVSYSADSKKGIQVKVTPTVRAKKDLVGVDVFLQWNGTNAKELGDKLVQISNAGLKLSMITNRGVKVYPDGYPETFCTDHWRCRYKHPEQSTLSYDLVLDLLRKINDEGFEIIKTENLYNFNGEAGYSAGQGQ